MNEIKIFKNEEFGEIRTIEIDGQIYFVGADVAKALGYVKTRNAIHDHVDEEDKKVFNLNTALKQGGIISIGNPNVILINESGLYSLILSSKLESAKKFKHWVTAEVLPAIRRTGTYGVSNIEEIISKVLDERIENVVNRVLDEKMNSIVKTLDQNADRRMNSIIKDIKESIIETSCETVNTLIPCFLYTHKKLKKLHKKLKNK